MLRALTIVALLTVLPVSMSGQAPVVLHIKVTLMDSARTPIPISRHALLISDDPATSVPRRVITGADGTVDVSLAPGRYTVESDQPVAFGGKGYQWTQSIVLAAGRTLVLELTAANAEAGAAPAPAAVEAPAPAPPVDATLLLLPKWQDSVVAIWTPTARASGFVVDAAGFVVTNAHAVGSTSTAVEVQVAPSVKVAARVLAADRTRDVAVLWIAPSVIASVRPVPMVCAAGSTSPISEKQEVVAIGSPIHGQKELSLGDVTSVGPAATVADLGLAAGSTGGPVFSAAGDLLGISSTVDGDAQPPGGDTRIVPLSDACDVVSAAQKATQAGAGPSAARLPVEVARPFPADALEAAIRSRAGRVPPYTMSSADFDIAFLTPVVIYAAQHAPPPPTNRFGVPEPEGQPGQRLSPTDFGDWSDYFEDGLSVLVVRVTPKFEEGAWTKFARGAAYTQGMALPPIKRFKPGFSRLRAFCGDVEVLPIHPFVLAQRVSETDAIREGLYVFDPLALGPQCGSVKLGLFSEKAPDKEDVRAIDPAMIDRIWKDFILLPGR